MKNIKELLHELRCDIACIPRTEDNKEEIKNATQTLQMVWDLVSESDSLPCVNDSHFTEFCCYLTGHDEKTVIQMYEDWKRYR